MFNFTSVEMWDGNAIYFALTGPRGAMSLTVLDMIDHLVGDLSYHSSISRIHDEDDNPLDTEGPCELLGELPCYCSGRSIDKLTSIDDDVLRDYLTHEYISTFGDPHG